MRLTSRLVPLLLVSVTVAAAAQVPLSQEPRHRLVFENADLRVLDVRVPPGDTTLEHRHDRDLVTVSMNETADTRTQSPGRPWGPTRPRRPVGDIAVTEYAQAPGSHRMENVGGSPYHLFAVENRKAGGWSGATPVSAQATRLTADARAFRVYDVRLDRDGSQTSHTHGVPTVVVLIAGSVMSEGPDAQAAALAPAPVGLKRVDQPGQWVLVPAGDTHHLVRLGTTDARLVEIEVR